MMLAAITILATTGGLLAFNARKNQEPYFCQANEGPCTYTTIKYKVSIWGQLRYCNNGAGSTICNNQLRVVVND